MEAMQVTSVGAEMEAFKLVRFSLCVERDSTVKTGSFVWVDLFLGALDTTTSLPSGALSGPRSEAVFVSILHRLVRWLGMETALL